MSFSWLTPDWPAPANVRAASTLRRGGVSGGNYASLNLGAHVGDDALSVAENRHILRKELSMPSEPVWLNQVHGSAVVRADNPSGLTADAAITTQAEVVCVVMTADCLPILLCDVTGSRVAAVHAGWRGLSHGVIEQAVTALQSHELLAWLGPAIGPQAFQVGDEVYKTFTTRIVAAEGAFRPDGPGKWRADLYELARVFLNRAGVKHIYGGDCCTYSDSDRFFSYRRDSQTGRMASLIWREL